MLFIKISPCKNKE